ncbi:hypothetical protein PR048_028000 [Dryococelus australis]|uniref:CBM39 domain-containing protein n=1 Tax=Dryococelus australis TaxID=614101 RepID=A0ABQ9GI40_9NEOP|nr:hypothetical protein PR048_028000 [Dryococelus australis]
MNIEVQQLVVAYSKLLQHTAELLQHTAECRIVASLSSQRLVTYSPAGSPAIIHSEGLEIFAFHGSVNKPLKGLEAGDMSRDILIPSRGRWVFEEPQIQLLEGDVIYFWLYVQRNGLGYRKDASYWIVNALAYYELKKFEKAENALQRLPEPPSLHSPPGQVETANHTAPPSTAQAIIESLMKNNCTSESTNSVLNRDPLLYLLEGYVSMLLLLFIRSVVSDLEPCLYGRSCPPPLLGTTCQALVRCFCDSTHPSHSPSSFFSFHTR